MSPQCTLVTVLLCSFMALALAVPFQLEPAVRMDEPPEPEPPVIVIDEPSIPEETPPLLAEEVPVPTTMETTTTATEETPVAASETEDLMPSAEAEPHTPSEPTSSVPYFSYNIGGDSFGQVQADPVQYVYGETLIFNMPDAEITGASPVIEEVYKSHRYGMLGSAWGYDLPVQHPGYYTCKLHYCETYSEFFTEEPNRTFEVTLVGDGQPEKVHKQEFDVMAELGGSEFTAYDRTFQDIAVSSELVLREKPSKGDAFLSGITCIWTAPLK